MGSPLAVKLSCYQLSQLQKREDLGGNDSQFQLACGLPVAAIWLSGFVRSATTLPNAFELDDGSGTARVVVAKVLPGGAGHLEEGAYVLVNGGLKVAKKGFTVRAYKVTVQDNGEKRARLWQAELAYLHGTVYDELARRREAAPAARPQQQLDS